MGPWKLGPPKLLASISEVDALKKSPEPMRLVGCLSLYYILLSRDMDNSVPVFYFTSLRGLEEMVQLELTPGSVQKCAVVHSDSSLLVPTRSARGKWNSGEFSLLALEELWYSLTHLSCLVEALRLTVLQMSLDRSRML